MLSGNLGTVAQVSSSPLVWQCTQTNGANGGTTDPWLMIDLLSVQSFYAITMYARSDCCYGRNVNFQILVGNSSVIGWSDPSNYLCPNPYTDIVGTSVTLSCIQSARYVWVHLPGTGRTLTVCELQVWQKVPYVWRALAGIAEVAMGKPATQSTTETCCSGGDPNRAVDGLTQWNYNAQPSTCSSTIGNPGSTAWWQVDLGAVYDISEFPSNFVLLVKDRNVFGDLQPHLRSGHAPIAARVVLTRAIPAGESQ